jgi:integrase/recombinase XerC
LRDPAPSILRRSEHCGTLLADDPCAVSKAHVEAFQALMIQTRSASTALNKYTCLQQLFRWLQGDEQAIDRNPMDRVRPPKTPTVRACRSL